MMDITLWDTFRKRGSERKSKIIYLVLWSCHFVKGEVMARSLSKCLIVYLLLKINEVVLRNLFLILAIVLMSIFGLVV